ncbi:uncharacterized protein LOC134290766 [Aedes albopictus]|uniref:Integrase catalytic domain-containing protein n=1 Tax=Aedes albopictus TaxID=7160 RepID=A0ABM1XZ48_AEDAL
MFIRRCRNVTGSSQKTKGLNQEDYRNAEIALWRLAQQDAYAEELKQMGAGYKCRSQKNSTLRKLSPFIDKGGEIRMGGRIGASPFASYDAKYPVILPKGHRVTELVIDSCHRMYGHQNGETVVNELRQKYHISNLRAEVHYFGPYLIKIGRSAVKRWVVLYTCLTIRAVHLEVAASLSTESCMLALRRFIARRGAPQKIYTDNGTNFVGTERELSRQLEDVNQKLSESFTNANTSWNFIPPASPHMGGAWERMVRAVKAAMSSINHSRTVTEEVFYTVLCEAESMVNSRPLTYMPLEGSDQEALTPNHFLLMNSDGVTQTEKSLTEERETLRKTKDVEVDDIVFIVDGNIRNRWVRGKVTAVFAGKDGRIRQAEVRTNSGILRRPFVKLAVMDIVSESKAEGAEQLYGPGIVDETVTHAGRPSLSRFDHKQSPGCEEATIAKHNHVKQ